MRTMARHLRMAWLEYLDPRDGAVFAHAAVSRLGFNNAFSSLPSGPSRRERTARNLVNSKLEVCSFRGETKTFRGLIGRPGSDDQALLEKWVCSPAVHGDELAFNPNADAPIDLLVVSGHGSGGVVWGDGSGTSAYLHLPRAFAENVAEPRSGRLKCIIVASCNNLHEKNAPLWLPMFNHAKPIHLLLGYEDSYAGGAIGAHVMARFVDAIARDRRIPLIEAWSEANEGERRRQPWAALVAPGAESMNLECWIEDDLPALANITELHYFDGKNRSGRRASLVDERFAVNWVMADDTVIDRFNNSPDAPRVGLIAGQRAKIRIRANASRRAFYSGEELYLFIYSHRETKDFNIHDLLEIEPGLLLPHPSTGEPVVTVEKGRKRNFPDRVDALRIVVPDDTRLVELDITVKASATKAFKPDGPAGTHGRFLLHLVFDYFMVTSEGQRFVAPNDEGAYFAGTAGAWLRRSS